MGIWRSPFGPRTRTTASSAASATHMSLGMRGDALLALAQDGVHAIVSFERAAAAARLALVAGGKIRIVKIRAARALQKIAADGGHIAQLRAGAGEQGLARAPDSAA